MSDKSTSPATSGAPVPEDDLPRTEWAHHALYLAVRNAIYALPTYFQSELNIIGVPVADLQNFNTSLGASIESHAVETLNAMRTVWDPDAKYAEYTFVRQAQRFPDVILRSSGPNTDPAILMGIELKGWYVLSKEAEPSFRYQVTPAVCADCDLLVVVPWALTNVVSGTPRLFTPYVAPARFAARLRNWHWQFKRVAATDPGIALSQVSTHYPAKSELIQDRPLNDAGKNFGRYARSGLMDDYMAALFAEDLYGIPLRHWLAFFKALADPSSADHVSRRLATIGDDIASMRPKLAQGDVSDILASITGVLKALAEAHEGSKIHRK